MALKASERSALTRILNNRFKVLKEELEQRRDELTLIVQQRLEDESRERTKACEARVSEFQAKANELYREFEAYLDEQRADGYVPGRMQQTWEPIYDGRGRHVKNGAMSLRTFRESPLRLTIDDAHFVPVDPAKRLKDALDELTVQHGAGDLSLSKQRADLEEKILLGQIETTEAQALLASIPTVDGFLPTAKKAEALLAEGDPQPEVASKPAKKRAPAKKK